MPLDNTDPTTTDEPTYLIMTDAQLSLRNGELRVSQLRRNLAEERKSSAKRTKKSEDKKRNEGRSRKWINEELFEYIELNGGDVRFLEKIHVLEADLLFWKAQALKFEEALKEKECFWGKFLNKFRFS